MWRDHRKTSGKNPTSAKTWKMNRIWKLRVWHLEWSIPGTAHSMKALGKLGFEWKAKESLSYRRLECQATKSEIYFQWRNIEEFWVE